MCALRAATRVFIRSSRIVNVGLDGPFHALDDFPIVPAFDCFGCCVRDIFQLPELAGPPSVSKLPCHMRGGKGVGRKRGRESFLRYGQLGVAGFAEVRAVKRDRSNFGRRMSERSSGCA